MVPEGPQGVTAVAKPGPKLGIVEVELGSLGKIARKSCVDPLLGNQAIEDGINVPVKIGDRRDLAEADGQDKIVECHHRSNSGRESRRCNDQPGPFYRQSSSSKRYGRIDRAIGRIVAPAIGVGLGTQGSDRPITVGPSRSSQCDQPALFVRPDFAKRNRISGNDRRRNAPRCPFPRGIEVADQLPGVCARSLSPMNCGARPWNRFLRECRGQCRIGTIGPSCSPTKRTRRFPHRLP